MIPSFLGGIPNFSHLCKLCLQTKLGSPWEFKFQTMAIVEIALENMRIVENCWEFFCIPENSLFVQLSLI